jgi:tetratricopeptide (TPR) repeat protein
MDDGSMRSKQLNQILSVATFVAMTALGGSVGLYAQPAAAQEQKASDKPTRKTPALRAKVYEQLARAQSMADNGNIADAVAILDEVKDKASSMNSYELAMMYNFYGFVYYNDENYDKALENFEQVVDQQPIPESFELSTLFSLAQLHLMQGNYKKSIVYLERWEALNTGKVPAKNLVIKAQAYYQDKQYAQASKFIGEAVTSYEDDGMIPDEGWLILQRAIFYELKQPEAVKDVLVKLVKLYNAPKYWIQLAGMYGELGQEKAQLAIMETAYQQGYIHSAGDVFNLAQLYYYHKAPYKAALLIDQAINDGVLERNLRNLKFLGQSWTAAKEQDHAVPAMQAAANLSEDGELDAQLAQIFLNMENWDSAIEASEHALEKGQLRNPGIAHLIKGMALYNKKEYARALNELAEAEKHKSSRGMAQQWKQFVESEKITQERLQAELDS